MDAARTYSRRGGAWIGGLQGSWPFGKIQIAKGTVTVSVLGRRRTLGVAEVLRVAPLGFSSQGGSPGVRIFFRGKHWEEYVDFHSLSAWREVLDELKQQGFTVDEPPKR